MSFLHKETERLRHRKQVSLLNKVMEYVPKLYNEFQTKVRKLRHLVIYTRYIKMIHMQLRKGMYDIKDCPNAVKDDTSIAPMYEIVKVCEPRRNNARTHIVFLQSANKKKILKRNTLSDNIAETHYNYLDSSAITESEYKVPEDMSINEYSDQVTLPSCDPNTISLIENASVFSDEHLLYGPVQLNNYEMVHNELETNLALDDSFYNEKENCQPFEMDKSALSYNGRRINEDKFTYDPESFVKNINILSNSSEFKTNEFIQSSDSYILNDITYSNAKKNTLKISNLDYVSRYKNYPSFGVYTNYYDSGISTNAFGKIKNNVYENSDVSSYTNYFSSLVPGRLGFSNCNFSLPENSCDNCSSCTSNERINVETENFSDSYPSCSNYTDNSSVSFKSKSNSCGVGADSEVALSAKCVLPVKSEILEGNYSLPELTNYNFSPGDTLTNKINYIIPKYDSVSQLYSDPTYLNMSDRPNSTLLQPGYSLCNKMMNSRYFPNDCYPQFSSPINDGSQTEEYSFLQPKSDVKTLNSPGSYSGNISEPSFFNNETSYPFAQVVVNCKT